MTGIEILSQLEGATSYRPDPLFGFLMFGLIFFIILILGTCVGAAAGDAKEGASLGFISGVIFGIFFGILATFGSRRLPSTYETQYKITIDDSVSMTEFYEHYEVIDQEGKIFTVREKTNE